MKNIYYSFTRSIAITAFLLFATLSLQAQTPQYFITGGTSSNSFPFNSTSSNKVQWIYTAGSFAASPSGLITKVYFRTGTTAVGNNKTFTNVTIKMGYTTQVNTTTTFIPGLTTVFFASSHFVASVVNGGWQEFTLTTPFFYDNTQNLVVEASQTAYTPSGFSVLQSTAGGNKRTWGGVTALTGSAGTGLADFGFNLLAYQNNASVSAIPEPTADICVGTYPVKTQVKNTGANVLNNVRINWSVNGVVQPFITHTTPVAVGATSAPITLGNVSLINPVFNNSIVVWTSHPNNVADPQPIDDTLSIIRKPLDIPNAVIYYPTTRVCPGDSVLLQAGTGPNYSYIWQFNADPIVHTQSSLYAKADGYYSVKVFNPGCNLQSAPVKITVKPLEVDLGPDLITCEKMPAVTLDAGEPGAQYLWNTGETTQTIQAKEGAIKYWVEAKLGQFCHASDTVSLTIDPLPRVNGISYVRSGSSYTYTFAPAGTMYVDTYLWEFGDGGTDTSKIATHTYSIAPPYNVTLKVYNSCGVVESKLAAAVEIDDVNAGQLSIYPNPAYSTVNITTGAQANISHVKIVNMLGVEVINQRIDNAQTTAIDISNLPDGHYTMLVTTSKGQVNKLLQVSR